MKRDTIGVGLVLIATTIALACVEPSSAAVPHDATIREMVAREAQLEMAAWSEPITNPSSGSVVLKSVDLGVRGVRIFEASPPVDHWHRYVVAADSVRVWRLSGFVASEMTEFYNAFLLRRTNSREGLRLIISLAEPIGDRMEFEGERSGSATIWRRWVSKRPGNWPRDTIQITSSGAELVRQTVLVQQVNSYAQSWVPVVYTALFSNDGKLLGWARREGSVP